MSSTQSNLSHRLWSHMITQGVRISPWTERKDLFENQMILTGWCLANWVFGALGMSLPDSLQHQPVKLFTWAFPRALPVEDQSWVHGEGRVDHKGSQRKLVVFFCWSRGTYHLCTACGVLFGSLSLGGLSCREKMAQTNPGSASLSSGWGKAHPVCSCPKMQPAVTLSSPRAVCACGEVWEVDL